MPSAITDIRLREMRFSTYAFINDRPTIIALMPSRGTKIQTPSGSHDYGPPVARVPQRFRVCRFDQPDGINHSTNDGGMVRRFGYQLVGAWDAIVAIGDSWDDTLDDNTVNHYHVDSIEPSDGYEVRANVTAFAQEPKHG